MKTFTYLFDLPAFQVTHYPGLIAGGHWHQGVITTRSVEQLNQQIKSIAINLLEFNIQPRDRILLVTDQYNLEWLATDMAIMAIRAVSVPIHYPQPEADFEQIFERIHPALVIYKENLPIQHLFSKVPAVTFNELVHSTQNNSSDLLQQLDLLRQSISPDDIATIVHTSGTSGQSSAVCLSHHNISSNVMSVLSLVPFTPGTRVMSFLPLSHIFERIVCYVYLACGASIYFLDSYRYAIYAMKDIKPDYFTSVPLILERFAAALEDRIEEMGWFTRWAYESWERKNRGLLAHVGSLIAHQWIIKRWKRKMGGQLKGIISGAAYLDPQVERLYERGGIRIRQGYGLTEASPVISINRFEPGGHKRGTVGLPIPGVKVQIAADGEVLVQGPNIMIGYYQDKDATRKKIVDGWLHTGDIGYFDDDKFLIITDRKSNIYKHASGKFISPTHIESILVHHPLIRYAMIIGYHRPYTVALILPDFDALKKSCNEKQIHWTAPEYMVHNTLVMEYYRDVLNHLDLQSHERIEKFHLLADTWSPENGLLSATFKPRRTVIEARYSKEIDEMYGE
jgi:long-chain acyl-CoA synthetase